LDIPLLRREFMKWPVRIQNGQFIVAVRSRGICTKRAMFGEIAPFGFLRISEFRIAGHHSALIQRHYAIQHPESPRACREPAAESARMCRNARDR
jgi:hypothetical protein